MERRGAMYRAGIRDTFRAIHSLEGDFGDENQPHAHTYVVEWICATDGLDSNGFSVDIALMETALRNELESIEGKNVNSLPFFEARQSSVENLARFLYEKVAGELKKSSSTDAIKGIEIKIWESDSAWASYAVGTL
jgi:6-pyruvoyltetrahydropterin/6-carboxytetrahydropterin synthase